MPIMPLMLPYDYRSRNIYTAAPKGVSFSLLSREMAWTVHGQTLERLAERGGLCPSEMLSLMTNQNIFRGEVGGQPLLKMDKHFAIAEINKLLAGE